MQNEKVLEEIRDFLFESKIDNWKMIQKHLFGDNQYMEATNNLITDLEFEKNWCVFGETAVNYKKWQLLDNKAQFFKEKDANFKILEQHDFDEFKKYLKNLKEQSKQPNDSSYNPYSNIPITDLEAFKNIVLKKDYVALGEFFENFYKNHKKEISYNEIFKNFNIKKDKGYRARKYYKLNLKYDNKTLINNIPTNILDLITKKNIGNQLQKKIIKKLEAGTLNPKSIEDYIYSKIDASNVSYSHKKLEKLSEKVLSNLNASDTFNLEDESLNEIKSLLHKIQEILKRGQ